MSRRGSALLDVLVGTALGVVLLSALTAAVGTGSRLMATAGARGEADDTVHLAVDALAFDARRAGFDPAGAGIAPLAEALPERVTFEADLDGSGFVDTSSEESTAYLCAPASRRLSRIIGRQSLPLAEGVTQCAFRYLDAAGAAIPLPSGGLNAAARARVRVVELDLTLRAARLRARSERRVLVALRTAE
jgi:Tfp pilus assembly protein PilW